MNRNCVRWCVGLVFAVWIVPHGWAQVTISTDPSALSQLRRSLQNLSGLGWVGRSTEKIDRLPDGVSTTEDSWTDVVSDGKRWSVVLKRTGDSWINGKLEGFSEWNDAFCDGKQSLQIELNWNNDFRVRAADPKTISPQGGPNAIRLLGSIDSGPPLEGVDPWVYMRLEK